MTEGSPDAAPSMPINLTPAPQPLIGEVVEEDPEAFFTPQPTSATDAPTVTERSPTAAPNMPVKLTPAPQPLISEVVEEPETLGPLEASTPAPTRATESDDDCRSICASHARRRLRFGSYSPVEVPGGCLC